MSKYGSHPELRWIAEARKYIGQKEIKGPRHNSLILRMWEVIRTPWYKDDETPWCAAYVGFVLENVGIKSTRSARALSYKSFGKALNKPAYGCLAVMSRNGGGHVGFVVGKDRRGNLMVLGGNQSDMVKISPYAPMGRSGSRIVAYRWPTIWPHEHRFNLPILTSDGKFETNES